MGARRFPQALGEREREREREIKSVCGFGLAVAWGYLGWRSRVGVRGCFWWTAILKLCRGGFGRMVVCVVVLLRPWIYLAPSPIFFEFGLSFVFLFN